MNPSIPWRRRRWLAAALGASAAGLLGGGARSVRTCRVKPVIDRVFPFEQALDAVRCMETGGKIVIRVA